MNKQAITFLSLFTLILVLSIYYLLVPPINQSETVSKKTLSRIEALQNELNKNHENKINDNNTVIASFNFTTIFIWLPSISQKHSL